MMMTGRKEKELLLVDNFHHEDYADQSDGWMVIVYGRTICIKMYQMADKLIAIGLIWFDQQRENSDY